MLDSCCLLLLSMPYSIVSVPLMRSALLVLAAMLCLLGCGKRGPLYLPDSQAQVQGTQATTQETQRR